MGGLGFAMALQFTPDGHGGWLYRKDRFGPALPATAEERDAWVSWFGWMVVLGFVLFFVAMILLAMVANALFGEASQAMGAIVAIGMAVIAMGGLWLLLRWWNHAPARAFAGRAPIGPVVSRREVLAGPMAKMTYGHIVSRMLILMAICLIGVIRTPGAWWLAIALPLVIGGGFALWKWRVESGD